MIIDTDTWKSRSSPTAGLPVFVSWKRLKELMVGDQKAFSIEVNDHGLLFRVDMHSYDERGKHPMMDKQV